MDDVTPPLTVIDDVTVREAKERDCEDIMQMIKELAAFQNLSHSVAIDENTLRRDGFGDRRYFYCFVAERTTQEDNLERRLVGYSMYYFTYSPLRGKSCCLEDIYVQPDCRGKGLGSRLWAHVTQKAIEDDCDFVQWVVLDWNKGARDFYERNGAQDVSKEEGWLLYRMTRQTMQDFVTKTLPPQAQKAHSGS